MPSYLWNGLKLWVKLDIVQDFILNVYKCKEDKNIIFTSKEFQPYSKTFDKSYTFVGTTIVDRDDDIEFPFDILKENPIVSIKKRENQQDRKK